MKKENDKKVYFTNMDDEDPVIEKFLKEYLEAKEDETEIHKSDELMVNFDITYADGSSESYTCGNESEVFGDKEHDYSDEMLKKYDNVDKDEKYYKENDTLDIESEIGKWSNCVDEWCGCSGKKKDKIKEKKEKCECTDKHEEKEECEGKITVYSILSLKKSTTLKGVTINLYKINGIKPELVESKATDDEGKVEFKNVPEGNYRIIELIDKNYFEKPVYLTWNEVNITKENKEYVLYVLNTLKNYKNN